MEITNEIEKIMRYSNVILRVQRNKKITWGRGNIWRDNGYVFSKSIKMPVYEFQ